MNSPATRLPWGRLAGRVLLAFAVVAGSQLVPVPSIETGELDALRAERTGLPQPDADLLAELRSRTQQIDATGWTDERLARVQEKVGTTWTWTPDKAAEAGWRSWTLVATNADLTDWGRLLELCASLSRESGLRIVGCDLSATGTEGRRRFHRLSVTIRLREAPGHAEPAGKPRGSPLRASATGQPRAGDRPVLPAVRPSAPPPQPAEAPAPGPEAVGPVRPPAARSRERT